MRTAQGLVLAALILSAGAGAWGDLIIPAGHSNYGLISGAVLDDVALRVGLSVSGGWATFTFTNVSGGLEATAVIKEIVVDTYDDDTATAILWNGSVLTDTHDVAFSWRPFNGLPGYADALKNDAGMAELQANSSPVKYGLGLGEALEVRFQTALADGASIGDYLAAFGGAGDSAAYSIGFHAISATIVDGQSLSGAVVPEPGSLALLAAGGAGLLARRKRRT